MDGNKLVYGINRKSKQYYPKMALGDDMNSVPIRVSYVDFGQITGILELEEQNIAGKFYCY